MRILFFIAMCCTVATAQEMLKITQIDTTRTDWFLGEAGVRVPLGKLADVMGPSPEVGLWYRRKIDHGDMLDLGGSFYLPVNKREFEQKSQDGIFHTDAIGVSGMLGCRFSKLYQVRNTTFEWTSAFGYAFFTYDDEAAQYSHENFPERYDDDNKEHSSYVSGLSTFHIGQGIRIRRKNFGAQLHYNYTPYGMFSKVVAKDFGAHSLSLGITYRQ
ncbi:MAG: hypothetical protein ACO1N9_12540 [Flavobacterium sp.]